jgi:hypothetical protein
MTSLSDIQLRKAALTGRIPCSRGGLYKGAETRGFGGLVARQLAKSRK